MGLPRLSKQTSSKMPALCKAAVRRSPPKRLEIRPSGLFFHEHLFLPFAVGGGKGSFKLLVRKRPCLCKKNLCHERPSPYILQYFALRFNKKSRDTPSVQRRVSDFCKNFYLLQNRSPLKNDISEISKTNPSDNAGAYPRGYDYCAKISN